MHKKKPSAFVQKKEEIYNSNEIFIEKAVKCPGKNTVRNM